MKNALSRLLSLLLVCVTLFSLLPLTADAATTTLGTPTDLTLNKVTGPTGFVTENGGISWKGSTPADPSGMTTFEIKLYRNGKLWSSQQTGYNSDVIEKGHWFSYSMNARADWQTGTYYFTVQAISQDGSCNNSAVVKSETWDFVRPSKTLAKPTNLGFDWPYFTWDAVDGHKDNYEVLALYCPNAEDKPNWFHNQWNIHDTRNTPPPFVDINIPGYYYFQVRAISNDITQINSSNWTDLSEPYYVAQKAPTIKGSNVASSGKVKLTWDAVDYAVKYQVYRATSKNGTYKLMKTTTSTSYTNTSAEAGKTYYYKVRAVSENGVKSAYSNIITRTCDLERPDVSVSNVASSGKVKVSWDKVDGAVKYQVYRATSKTGEYKLLKTTTNTSFTNTGAVARKTYYYKVKAIAENSAADSAYSTVESRTCDLARPDVSISRNSKGQPKLTWDKVDGAVEYKVYRATSKNGTYKLMKTTTKTSYTNTSATAGKTYYYKVKAIASKSAANSAYSTVDSIKAK